MIDVFKVIASAVIFNSQGQVLLGQRSFDEEVYPGLWGIPGGKVEASASSKQIIESTLAREALEEMGIKVKLDQYLTSDCVITDKSCKLYLIYTASLISGQPQALEDTIEVKWWNIDQIRPEMLTPNTYQNIHHAASLRNP